MLEVSERLLKGISFSVHHPLPCHCHQALPSCRPRLEFCRGLVELTIDKLLRDLPDLQYDDATFSHTVDETLQLQRGLAQLGYGGGGGDQPGPLLAVCQPGYLRRWVAIERKYALERMDQMLASETAWIVQGEPEGGVTEVRGGEAGLMEEGKIKVNQCHTSYYDAYDQVSVYPRDAFELGW